MTAKLAQDWARTKLCRNISKIRLATFLGNTDDVRSLGFTDQVVSQDLVLLLERRLWAGGLHDDAVIVTKHAGRPDDLNSHHAKLDTEALDHLRRNAGGHQLARKGRGLHRTLSFAKPQDGSTVDKDDDSGVGAASIAAASMVSILKAASHHWSSPKRWCIGRVLLLGIRVEV